MTLEIPVSSRGREIIVHDAPGTGARMQNSVIADIDGDMVHLAAATREQQQVPRLQRCGGQRQRISSMRLLP